MKPKQLLRLYPRQWRRRYGDEFLALVGSGALSPQKTMNVVMGAIDAWLSADVRRSVGPEPIAANSGGQVMLNALKAACVNTSHPVTTRNALISAAVMLGATAVLAATGIALGRSGYPVLGEGLTSIAFPVALTLSMPFSFLKGQPWRAQAVVVGGTFLILLAATYVATLI